MAEDEVSNIFEAAAGSSANEPSRKKKRKGEKKRVKKKSSAKRRASKGSESPAVPFGSMASQAQTSLTSLKDMTLQDPELRDLYERVEGRIKNFDDEVEKACARYGVTREQLDEYMNTEENFLPAEWKEMQEVNQAWEDVLGVKKKGAEQRVDHGPKQKSKGAKSLKGKMLGSRKGWMPM